MRVFDSGRKLTVWAIINGHMNGGPIDRAFESSDKPRCNGRHKSAICRCSRLTFSNSSNQVSVSVTLMGNSHSTEQDVLHYHRWWWCSFRAVAPSTMDTVDHHQHVYHLSVGMLRQMFNSSLIFTWLCTGLVWAQGSSASCLIIVAFGRRHSEKFHWPSVQKGEELALWSNGYGPMMASTISCPHPLHSFPVSSHIEQRSVHRMRIGWECVEVEQTLFLIILIIL